MMPTLWAVSDLHAAVAANHEQIDLIQPTHGDDWLIVAGDVAERRQEIVDVLRDLRSRFAQVIWVPGNHELFAKKSDDLTGRDKYIDLVGRLRHIGVMTPEDPYMQFAGVTVCPLFTLYDYSFRPQGITVEEALAQAEDNEVVLTDEYAIAPFVDIRAWCWDRLAYSVARLARITGPTVLINHWPLIQEPTMHLHYPEIALWSGTKHTKSWPTRYNAQAVVYGHLHLPAQFTFDGVVHHEVSLGYPREWHHTYGCSDSPEWPRKILEAQ